MDSEKITTPNAVKFEPTADIVTYKLNCIQYGMKLSTCEY